MKRRRIARSIGVMAAVVGLAFTSSGQAGAIAQTAITYDGPSWCIYGQAAVDEAAFSGAVTFATHPGCGGYKTVPAHTLSVERVLLAYDMPNNRWYECNRTTPVQNTTASYFVNSNSSGHATCGLGQWYASFTAAYAWDGTAWRGAWVGSNNQWVPVSLAAKSAVGSAAKTSASPSAPKTSAADAVKRGEVRRGSSTGPRIAADELLTAPTAPGGN
ncbi:hypothetical protein [Streptomyces sp. KL118A]|uniref:hypothetical protein n=1 Tax=Streptomyces sp. KL118A TaxID=3045153 RepID=UPI00278BF669|nr:hypothetical protein [Streptomyces sp. KL118A]